jgi:hypothetical protein
MAPDTGGAKQNDAKGIMIQLTAETDSGRFAVSKAATLR